MSKEREKVYTPLVAKPHHGISQAIKYGDLVFVSGQVGEGLDEVPLEGIEAQVEKAIENLKAVLEAAGSSLDKVIMCRCFIQNMEDIGPMNQVYDKYFADMEVGPARYTVVASPVAKDYLFEIAAFAAI